MKPDYIDPDIDIAKSIASNADAQSQLCWTCGTCDFECPVFLSTERLRPQKTVRMANLGLSMEVLKSPAIWLCLGCQRCTDACSQLVRGYDLIRRFQGQAVAEGFVDPFFSYRLIEADRIIYPQFLNQIDILLGMFSNIGTQQNT